MQIGYHIALYASGFSLWFDRNAHCQLDLGNWNIIYCIYTKKSSSVCRYFFSEQWASLVCLCPSLIMYWKFMARKDLDQNPQAQPFPIQKIPSARCQGHSCIMTCLSRYKCGRLWDYMTGRIMPINSRSAVENHKLLTARDKLLLPLVALIIFLIQRHDLCV